MVILVTFCNATVRFLLAYGWEACPLRVKDVNRLLVYDCHCFLSICQLRLNLRVIDVIVGQRVFGVIKAHSLKDILSLHQFRRFGHIIRMSS